MNNQDRFTHTLETEGPIAAAHLALEFANNCNSRNACWNWADKAIELVPSLATHVGKLTWPNTADMREHLETLTSAQALADDASNVKTALTSPASSPTLLDQAKLLAARATASIDSGSFDRAVACATLAQALAAIHQAMTMESVGGLLESVTWDLPNKQKVINTYDSNRPF